MSFGSDMDVEDFPSFLDIPNDHLPLSRNGSSNSLTTSRTCLSDSSTFSSTCSSRDFAPPLIIRCLRSSMLSESEDRKGTVPHWQSTGYVEPKENVIDPDNIFSTDLCPLMPDF
eukprot:733529_1